MKRAVVATRRALVAAFVVTGLATYASTSACFDPEIQSGSLRCGTADCPKGFSCASDGFCYRPGDGPGDGGGDLALGEVDQINLLAEGSSLVEAGSEIQQTFVVSTAGCLTAIELSVLQCAGTEASSMAVELFEGDSAAATALGADTLAGAQSIGEGIRAIPIVSEEDCATPPSLALAQTSSTLFDLRTSAIKVRPGTVYSFEMRAEGVAAYRVGTRSNGYEDGVPLEQWETPALPIVGDRVFKIFLNNSDALCL